MDKIINHTFEKGEEVYVYDIGWGEVQEDNKTDVLITFATSIKKVPKAFVSYCQYDLINGGLSHKKESFKIGKLCILYNNENEFINEIIRIGRVTSINNAGMYSANNTSYMYAKIIPESILESMYESNLLWIERMT